MKLRNKIIMVGSLAWLSFLLVAYVENYYFRSFYLISSLFLFCLMTLCLYAFIIKRLEKLNEDIHTVSSDNKFSRRLTISGKDEVSLISNQINNILDAIKVSREQLEKQAEERLEELEKTNKELKLEIEEHKFIEEEKELVTHQDHLIQLAHYDTLTSLPNRIFFNEMLNKKINHANLHRKTMAILLIDLDRFKNINEALGKSSGDLVLKEAASRFSKVLRVDDVLARVGEDEFIILLNDIGHPKLVIPIAEKLLQICAQPMTINHKELVITASIGICIYPNHGFSLEDLEKNAALAVYKSKKLGGGVFQYYTKEIHYEAHERLQWENEIKKAIYNNEFVLYYQPKLNLKDGSLYGVEALIRWEHPEQGIINPSAFIPLAEETGLIIEIGEWVLREACRANKAWQQQGYQIVPVAVNLSPKQFKHPNIAKLVASVLNESGLDPSLLELEITETSVMENVTMAINKLNDIKRMGVSLSLDDFGTGYTSISYLKQFPINFLKIDQMFIKGLPENQNDTVITTAIINLAHTLGMKVVAEGVETSAQLQYLAANHCDIVQGYYLSRPLPEHKIISQFSSFESLVENR